MKYFILILSLCAATHHGYSQDLLSKAKSGMQEGATKAKAMENDPATLAKAKDLIMNKLVPALKLSDAQKTSVGNAIDNYLKSKSNLQPTATSDPKGYAAKSTSLKSGLLQKMKGLLSKEQFANLLKMKPKSGDKSNPLSAIF